MVEKPVSLSIKSKIILISLFLSLTTLFVISVLSFITADRLIEERVRSQLQSESSGRGDAIKLLTDSHIQQLELLSTNDPIHGIVSAIYAGNVSQSEYRGYQERFISEIEEFKRVTGQSLAVEGVTVAGPDGRVLISTNETGSTFLDPAMLSRASHGESSLEFAPVNGARKAVIAVPYGISNQAPGAGSPVLVAITGTQSTDAILLNRKGLGETGEVYLVDSNRTMISESRFIPGAEFRQKVDTYPVSECLEAGREVSSVYRDYRNVPIVGSSYCAPGEGFILLAEIDQAEILQPVSSLRDAIIWTAAAITAVVVLTSLYVAKTISRPITKLRDAADRIAKGDYGYKVEVDSRDEVGGLAARFDDMRKSVLETNNNLNRIVRERTKELGDMTNALDATAIVAVTDKDGTITKVNKKFVEISKYSEGELVGQNHRLLKSAYHPPEFFESMWQTISSGRIFEGEIKNRAKDGSFYWVKTTIVPFLDERGHPKQYIAIHNDITDLKNIEEKLQRALGREREDAETIREQSEELKKAYIELQNKDRLKDAFLSMASHELKTPLTPIIGWCGALKSEKILGPITPPQKSAVDTIEKNAVKLEKMISDMLDVQKLELNELRFNIGRADIDRILRNIEKDFEFVMKEKNISFVVQADPKIVIESDEARISQVLSALLYNSVDFVPKENGRIEVSVRDRGNDVLFCVKDNGPGIPEDKKQYLFQKFYQVDTSLKRKHGGTGLGLAISKGIVTGLGGSIWFETEAGKGSSFYFSLPKGDRQ